MLKLSPVYLRAIGIYATLFLMYSVHIFNLFFSRVKRNKEGSSSRSNSSSSSSSPHNPLQSAMYSHLMSLTFMFTRKTIEIILCSLTSYPLVCIHRISSRKAINFCVSVCLNTLHSFLPQYYFQSAV